MTTGVVHYTGRLSQELYK